MTKCYIYYQKLKEKIEDFNEKNLKTINQKAQKLNDQIYSLIEKRIKLRGILVQFKNEFKEKNKREPIDFNDFNPVESQLMEYKKIKEQI